MYPRPTLDTFGTLEGFWGGEIAALVYGNMTQSGFFAVWGSEFTASLPLLRPPRPPRGSKPLI